MECEFAFICDSAQQGAGVKLHALGIGWDTIYAPELPARLPTLSFVARLKASVAEAGTQDISIRLINADGGDVIPPIEQQIPFEVPSQALVGYLNVVINLNNLELKTYGAYALHLVANKHEMVHLSFNVSPPPTTS